MGLFVLAALAVGWIASRRTTGIESFSNGKLNVAIAPLPGEGADVQAQAHRATELTAEQLHLAQTARAAANRMSQAFLKGDLEAYVGYLPGEFIELAGGVEKLKASMMPIVKCIVSMTVHEVKQVSSFGREALVIVPTTMRTLIDGTPGRSEGYLIGVSRDKGDTWGFVDGSDAMSARFKKSYPHLAVELSFPQKRQFIEAPGEPVMESIEVEGEMIPVGAFRDRVKSAVARIEQGVALYERGRRYYVGEGVEKDWNEAFKWFKKAADAGHLRGLITLGICYQRGKGTPVDLVEGARCLAAAADRKSPDAQYFLALCYRDGEGVPRDLVEARRLLRLAVENGHELAGKALQGLND